MAEIQIRAAELSDLDAIHALLEGERAMANTLNLPWRSVEERRGRIASLDPDDHRLVALIDGRVVGHLGLHVERRPRRRHCANIGMAVHDDFANRGIGSALMAAMIELADNWLGIHRLELTVYTDNAGAVHLYEKFGFVIEGTARDYALRAGTLVDAYYMARLNPRRA
jgi:L-phenylalanine/L-methionine N-acetyltransferase